jgi:F-type H+-transporting ATPase subunit epsilon
MFLEVIAFDGKAFSHDKVKSVNLMTSAWEITVLENHMPLTSVLKPWVVNIECNNWNWDCDKQVLAIWGWIIEINKKTVKILVDTLYTLDEVDAAEATDAVAKAEELMDKYKWAKDKADMDKFIQAEDMLMKSIAKLKLSKYK